MKHICYKLLALLLVVSLSAAPIAYAQELPANVPSVDASSPSVDTTPATQASDMTSSSSPAVTQDTATSSSISTDATTSTADQTSVDPTPSQSVDLQGSTAPVQDTVNTQSAASSSVLESTVNPETATGTDATSVPLTGTGTTTATSQPIDGTQSTSTDVVVPLDTATSSLDVVAENVKPVVPDPQTIVTPEPLVAAPIKDEPPQPQFTFALTGKQIPTKRKIVSGGSAMVTNQTIALPLATQVDNATGAVSVSGQCSDAYYVVLLYKNANDYADDPSSYIVNRAYPCVNGTYSYSLTDLPSNLTNGQYYLLVGQEGERTTWTPITSITEITINNK